MNNSFSEEANPDDPGHRTAVACIAQGPGRALLSSHEETHMIGSPRSLARRRAVAVLTVAATVAGGSALLGPGTSSASSHREAPYVSTDPAIDNTDVYAFVSPDKPDTTTLIANWAPFSEPGGGPTFFPWATDAQYDINVDNSGTAKPSITYRWTFKDVDKRGTTQNGDKAGGTFLYAKGPVKTLTDPNLLFRQTYTLETITYAADGTPVPVTTLKDIPVVPSHVGRATIPNYGALRQAGVMAGTVGSGPAAGLASYVGQAADPFFLDLRVFDLLYGANLSETGFNTLKGFNVNTISLQVPSALLAAGGDAKANPVIGVWSTTNRNTVRTLAATNSAPATSTTRSSDAVTSTGDFAQVSRLGNPLVNEVVVPANLKDYFNRSTPSQDAKVQAVVDKVQDPELPYLVQAIYGIKNPNTLAGGKNRPDIAAAFVTGISKKVSAGTTFGGLGKGSPNVDLNSLDLNAVSPNPTPAEYLRLNMSVPPASAAKYSRLGVIGGDVAGFPNGRRLGDDVVDIALQVMEGVLLGQPTGLGDGVNAGDQPLLGAFPYIGDPYSGSQPHVGQQPLTLQQSFTSKGGYLYTRVTNVNRPQPRVFAELYRINADGSRQRVLRAPINEAGTGTGTAVIPIGSGKTVTYFWAIPALFEDANSTGTGTPTTFTVR